MVHKGIPHSTPERSKSDQEKKPMKTKAKSVLVTGCSTGIGAYCARQLHAEGWQVFATARKPEDIEQLRQDGVEAFYLNYAEPESIAALADTIIERTNGTLYGLFNNGGYAQPGAVEDLPVDALRAQFEANVFGYLDLTNRLVPHMIARGEGRIIIHSSVLGFTPMRWSGAYNASKFALEGLYGSMSGELRDTGVKVSLLETGPVESKIGENSLLHYQKWLEGKESRHTALYEERLAEMAKPSDSGIGKFRKGPDAVYKRVNHALTSPKPKPRYFITMPTYGMGIAQRILTSKAFLRLAGSGR